MTDGFVGFSGEASERPYTFVAWLKNNISVIQMNAKAEGIRNFIAQDPRNQERLVSDRSANVWVDQSSLAGKGGTMAGNTVQHQ